MNYREFQMLVHYRTALELLRHKAVNQMCVGKTTCFINETDVNEVLSVAGLPKITTKDLEEKEDIVGTVKEL